LIQEFANLLELPLSSFKEGRHAIYELLNEDSSVNYWEKYGNIAFDTGQKAVLTSCVLKKPDKTLVECCFSFTIRRDRFGVPVMIVGHFIPCKPDVDDINRAKLTISK